MAGQVCPSHYSRGSALPEAVAVRVTVLVGEAVVVAVEVVVVAIETGCREG